MDEALGGHYHVKWLESESMHIQISAGNPMWLDVECMGNGGDN